MSTERGGCDCKEQLDFTLSQFKIVAVVALVLGLVAALFIADPGSYGH